MNADELGAAIALGLPRHSSVLVRMRMFSVVEAPYTADSGRCPRCGRKLPLGSLGPTVASFGHGGSIGIPRTAAEVIDACLVDGRRGRHGRVFPLDDLLGAALDISRALQDKGWKRWSRRLERALAFSNDPTQAAEVVGQTLELLRRFGPGALESGDELETLVTSFARYWPRVP